MTRDSVLVDPATGYRVQRIGSEGEADGFQVAGDSDMHVPYDVAMAATATGDVTVAGNLSSDSTLSVPQTNVLASNISFTTSNGTVAAGTAELDALDQFTAGTLGTATITVSGYDHTGNALVDATPLSYYATTTIDDVLAHINSVLGTSGTASLVNGKIRITDADKRV